MDYTLFDKYIGEQLYQARIDNGLTQDDMANRISDYLKRDKTKKNGISRQAYAFYENGDRSMPETIYHYSCLILGLDEDKVFNKANKKFMEFRK